MWQTSVNQQIMHTKKLFFKRKMDVQIIQVRSLIANFKIAGYAMMTPSVGKSLSNNLSPPNLM